MVAPLIIGAALVGLQIAQSIYDIYSTQKTTEASDKQAEYVKQYQMAAEAENARFFGDYIRAHHLEKRMINYPYRTGYVYNETSLRNASVNQLYNEYSRYGSYAHGFTSSAKSGVYAGLHYYNHQAKRNGRR